MCRSIKRLFHFDPPATDQEIRETSLQFVRKVSGFPRPSEANKMAYDKAVDEITEAVTRFLHTLKTKAPLRHRKTTHAI
jgi:hypothetical protein